MSLSSRRSYEKEEDMMKSMYGAEETKGSGRGGSLPRDDLDVARFAGVNIRREIEAERARERERKEKQKQNQKVLGKHSIKQLIKVATTSRDKN